VVHCPGKRSSLLGYNDNKLRLSVKNTMFLKPGDENPGNNVSVGCSEN